MNIYHQMIENPLFFKWIYQPSPEINTYWDHYLKQHPEEAVLIREFKSGFEKHFKYQKVQFSDKEKKELAIKILKRLEERDKQKKSINLIRLTLRYAAVAIFFLLIGSGITFYLFEQRINNMFVEIPPVSKMNLDEPTLIFDNDREIALIHGKSALEYSNDGKLKVNNEVVDMPEDNQNAVMNTLIVPYGNSTTVNLSDGTKVWLNAGSRLVYPSKFVDKNREVFIVGEAFFQVSKDEAHPFIVKTPDLNIRVLGTQFNISAYSDDNIIQTVLTEGSLEIGKTNPGLFEQSTLIKPGQLATLNKTNKETNVYDVDVEYYTGWKQGYLSFQNSDLSRIIKKLERYYNIHFKYENPMDGSIKLSGKLDISKDKEQALELITSITKLNFEKITEKTYLIK